MILEVNRAKQRGYSRSWWNDVNCQRGHKKFRDYPDSNHSCLWITAEVKSRIVLGKRPFQIEEWQAAGKGDGGTLQQKQHEWHVEWTVPKIGCLAWWWSQVSSIHPHVLQENSDYIEVLIMNSKQYVPVCVRQCLWSSSDRVNLLPQFFHSHTYGLSPECHLQHQCHYYYPVMESRDTFWHVSVVAQFRRIHVLSWLKSRSSVSRLGSVSWLSCCVLVQCLVAYLAYDTYGLSISFVKFVVTSWWWN